MMRTIFISLLFFLVSCGGASDFIEELPSGYVFIFEGGSQNRIYRNNGRLLAIDSGVVDCKHNDEFIVFSVDTTYSDEPYNINKAQLKYYIHVVKRDKLFRSLRYQEYHKYVKSYQLSEIDVSKKE